jgi:hypothetical protein
MGAAAVLLVKLFMAGHYSTPLDPPRPTSPGFKSFESRQKIARPSHFIRWYWWLCRTTIPSMAPPAAESCCCLRCGYSLTGLALPRPCPECGQPAEAGYEERARPVRDWFNSWSAWGWCLRRSARVPAGLFYVLHDAASRRTAWRRLLLVMCLPAILASLLALGGNSICVNYSVRVWWYNVHDPQRRVLREETETETDRLYGFNLHLPLFRGGLFFKKPS